MDDALLEKLQAVDPAILTDVVRQDRRDPSFEITNWSIKRLSDKGIRNPDGLWIFNGEGHTAGDPSSWSVVLKILERSEEEASSLWSWKRELLMVQSGLMERLPGPVKTPRFYRVEETPHGAWLWQEYIESHRPDAWTIDDYVFAAYQLGLWNGAHACGAPLPDQPWFARQHYRSWYTKADPDQDFQFPLNQKYIHGELRKRYDQLWSDRESLYLVLETLPQIFCHMDCQRRNLFIRKGRDGNDELVILDWAECGYGPLGAELYGLIGMSAALMEFPAAEVVQLDKAAFASYLHGLTASGWLGDPDTVRLAHTAWSAIWFGAVFPNIFSLWCTPDFSAYSLQQFGAVEEELYVKWLPMFLYSLDCADEARVLIKKLGFA